MKRILIAVLLGIFCLSAVLTACGGTDTTSVPAQSGTASSDPVESPDSAPESEASTPAVSETVSESEENSAPSQANESQAESEVSKPAENNSGMEVLFCSYSEKPYFAMIGKCADGATVFGESEGWSFSSESWHGWFSLRMKCTEREVDVKIYQQIDGQTVGEPYVYRAHPITPDSRMEGVVTGHDTQFFYQKNLPDFLKTNVPNDTVYNTLTTRVQARVNAIHGYNPEAEIIYLIVPASITVYPEAVPENYVSPEGESRLDKTIAAIRKGGGTAIDLREPLAAHKGEEMPLYYHFDTHWADYGGYIAYRELFDHISQKFPAAKPRPVEDFNWNPGYYESGDMTYYLNIPQEKVMDYGYYRKFAVDVPSEITAVPRYRRETSLVYSDAVTAQKRFRTDRSELPSCVVYRDSFGTQMYDIVAERMNVTNYMGMWNYTWNNNLIMSEKPDYVIYIVAEWNLTSIIYS